MALNEFKFFSRELYQTVQVDVVLPTPDSNNDFFDTKTDYPKSGQKYQVLYLLHGFSADHSDWQRFSRIETYAQKKQIAVVMPAAGNSFYTDMPYGGRYYSYLTQELPAVMQSLFPISSKRENTFIAGLSMGGYGAFKAAVLNPERYAAAASLSGGLLIEGLLDTGKGSNLPDIPVTRYLTGLFGEGYKHYHADKDDLFQMFGNAVAQSIDLPKLYQCCGTEDFIYPDNIKFRDHLLGLGIELEWVDGPGQHDFDFWDPYIRKILDWLPLKNGFVD